MKRLLLFSAFGLLTAGVLMGTANFPTSVSTDSNLYVAVNNCYTTLTITVNSSTPTITGSATTNFPSVGHIIIDNEIIKYTGKTAGTFTGCTRGSDGTTAAAHTAGKLIYHSIIAAHHNVLKDEIKAIESYFLTDSLIHLSTATSRVGINNASPAYTLDVGGNINTNAGVKVTYGVSAATGVFSVSITAPSFIGNASSATYAANGGSVSVGADIGGADHGSILFADANGKLDTNSTLTFSTSTQQLGAAYFYGSGLLANVWTNNLSTLVDGDAMRIHTTHDVSGEDAGSILIHTSTGTVSDGSIYLGAGKASAWDGSDYNLKISTGGVVAKTDDSPTGDGITTSDIILRTGANNDATAFGTGGTGDLIFDIGKIGTGLITAQVPGEFSFRYNDSEVASLSYAGAFAGDTGAFTTSLTVPSIGSPSSTMTVTTNVLFSGSFTRGGAVSAFPNINVNLGDSASTSTGTASVVSGGVSNHARGLNSVVAGGSTNEAGQDDDTVSGGFSNTALGKYSTVSGGIYNHATGMSSSIIGGEYGEATGFLSTILGGMTNTSSGTYSTTIGGESNTAGGTFSLAAGNRAKALHDGSRVFADSVAADFNSTAINEFAIRAGGGFRVAGNVMTVAVATQTITAAGTVAADQCGGVKRISSAGVVTSSTTTTFAIPTGSNQCRQDTCNVGAQNITLDYNSSFLSFGATDVLLTPNDCVSAAFDGVVWRQVAPVSVN